MLRLRPQWHIAGTERTRSDATPADVLRKCNSREGPVTRTGRAGSQYRGMSTHTTHSNPRHPSEFPLAQGVPVITRDGEQIGVVGKVLPEHFCVDPDGGDAYWLAKATLAEPNDSAAVLAFDKNDLELHQMEEPAARAASPVLDAASDAFEDEADMERTRRAMMAGEGEPVRRNTGL